MKAIKLLCTMSLVLISNISLNAQYILSLTVSPANPTTNDTITVYTECAFPSASCNDHTQSHFVNGNTISANTLHCVGPMTVICNDTDTFLIGTLPAGTYNFVLQVDAGWGPGPCTPGFNPGPSDTLTFVVDLASGIKDAISENETSVYPNPAKDYIEISFSESEALIEIFSVTGQLIRSSVQKNNGKESMKYDVSELSTGTYFISVKTVKTSTTKKFVKD